MIMRSCVDVVRADTGAWPRRTLADTVEQLQEEGS